MKKTIIFTLILLFSGNCVKLLAQERIHHSIEYLVWQNYYYISAFVVEDYGYNVSKLYNHYFKYIKDLKPIAPDNVQDYVNHILSFKNDYGKKEGLAKLWELYDKYFNLYKREQEENFGEYEFSSKENYMKMDYLWVGIIYIEDTGNYR